MGLAMGVPLEEKVSPSADPDRYEVVVTVVEEVNVGCCQDTGEGFRYPKTLALLVLLTVVSLLHVFGVVNFKMLPSNVWYYIGGQAHEDAETERFKVTGNRYYVMHPADCPPNYEHCNSSVHYIEAYELTPPACIKGWKFQRDKDSGRVPDYVLCGNPTVRENR